MAKFEAEGDALNRATAPALAEPNALPGRREKTVLVGRTGLPVQVRQMAAAEGELTTGDKAVLEALAVVADELRLLREFLQENLR